MKRDLTKFTLVGQNLNVDCLTLLMEDCRAAMDWKAVKSKRKANDITMTFFMMRRFSDRNSSWLRSILLFRCWYFRTTSNFESS